MAGKLDWLAANLPFEGDSADQPRAGTVARDDVPTCRLDEKLGEIRSRVQEAGAKVCVVVNEEQIVLGLLRGDELDNRDEAVVEDVMGAGPSTFRPHVPIEEMADYMTENEVESLPITTSEGRLVGLLSRDDALASAHEHHSHHH